MSTSAAIVGAGTYGEVYLHYLRASGVEVACFLDDDVRKHGMRIDGVEVAGGADLIPDLRNRGIHAVYVPIGNNAVRRRLLSEAKRAGLDVPSYIHPSAVIAQDLVLGDGCYVLPGSIIMPKVRIGNAVMISMGAHVAHHTTIGDGVFLSTGVSLGAGITVEQDAYFGMKATAVTGKCRRVGAGALIGACSNLLTDVPAGATVAGNPARMIGKVS